MFDRNQAQNQPMGDVSGVSLPNSQNGQGPNNGDNNGYQQPDHQIADHASQGMAETSDLLAIKQQALSQLSPLVSHLEQTPEEKFRTTMMMIQASDDDSLISEAYQAANAIEDEKAKAQALLDVINEINYFSQKHQG